MATSPWSEGTDVLAPLRAGNPQVPAKLAFSVSRSITIDDVTDRGEVIHVLPEVREPTGLYRNGLIITVDDMATTMVLGASDGRSGLLKVFTDDGGVSDIEPAPAWSPDGWEDFAIEMARSSLERRNSHRTNVSGTGRVAAADHGPLREFMARSSHRIGIRSWLVDGDRPFPGVEGARLEIWSAVAAVGPVTYGRVAAGYGADGTIVGLAAVEAMPTTHADAYLCLFTVDGEHLNLGVTSLDHDFAAEAVHALKPLLAPEPSAPESSPRRHAHPLDPAAAPTLSNAETLVLRYEARTDRGLVQSTNEDSVYAGPRLVAVADGVGQPAGGDVASMLAIRAVAALDDYQPGGNDVPELLHAAVLHANEAIAGEVASRPELTGMATTLTAILFAGRHFGLAHLGDSRCYLLRDGQVVQITRDDTVVQVLIDHNQLTAEQAADHPQQGQLTRTLNGNPVVPSLTMREARAGDRYLLCTRGLPIAVGIDRIYDTLRIRDLSRSAERLIELAVGAGGPDNVTVIVADVIDSAAASPAPDAAAAETPPAT